MAATLLAATAVGCSRSDDSAPLRGGGSPCGADADLIATTVGDDVPAVAVLEPGSQQPETISATWTASRPALSPDGRRVALTWADGDYESAGPGATGIRTLAIDGSDPLTLTTVGDADDAAWSPDGTSVAFSRRVDGHRRIERVPADGGASTVITDPPTDATDSVPAWAPDGERLAFVRHRFDDAQPRASEIWTAPADGRDQELVGTIDGMRINWLTWTPDGGALLAGGRRTGLWQVDLDGSVDQIAGKATMPAFSSDGRRLYVAYNRGGTWETWRATWTDGRVHLDEQLNLPIAFLYPHYGWSVAACADP